MMAESLSHFSTPMAQLFDPDPERVDQERRAGLGHDTLFEYHRAFGPGAGSEGLQSNMLNELIRLMCVPGDDVTNAVGSHRPQQQTRELYAWLKHIITQASMKSIYGPKHPFDDPEVEKAFWYVERSTPIRFLFEAPQA